MSYVHSARGGYSIDFGFPVSDRFIMATGTRATFATVFTNIVPYCGLTSANIISVGLWEPRDGDGPEDLPVYVAIF
jgi:hypothetical protein